MLSSRNMSPRAVQVHGNAPGSRRKVRMRAGAGVQVQEVNRILKQFEQMQQMMKMMKGGHLQRMMRNMKGMLPGMR